MNLPQDFRLRTSHGNSSMVASAGLMRITQHVVFLSDESLWWQIWCNKIVQNEWVKQPSTVLVGVIMECSILPFFPMKVSPILFHQVTRIG